MDSSGEIFALSSFFFSIIMFSANSRTWQIATWRRFWEPILRSLLIFQNIRKGSRNPSALVWTASSKALANSACGKVGDKYSGSYPKAVLQMLTNANRCSISWRSRTVLSAATAERIWIRRSESSVSTTVSTNLRRDLVLNSWLETCLWNFHLSPSELKMPSPRRPNRIGWKSMPFG